MTSKGFAASKDWIRTDGGEPKAPYPVTLSTYIRHSIHHPENTENADYTADELADSIAQLSDLIKSDLSG